MMGRPRSQRRGCTSSPTWELIILILDKFWHGLYIAKTICALPLMYMRMCLGLVAHLTKSVCFSRQEVEVPSGKFMMGALEDFKFMVGKNTKTSS